MSGGGSSGQKSRPDSDLKEPPQTLLPKQPRTDNRERLRLPHDAYTVGWVSALAIEMGAATAMLDEQHATLPRSRGDNNTYTLGSIGPHNIVLACLPSYGTTKAAAVANDMRRSFPNIGIGLMVGIGGGVPGGGISSSGGNDGADIRLGDVVVGDRVVQYDIGKIVCGGRIERTGGSGTRPSPNLATAVQNLRGRHETQPSQVPSIVADMLKRYPLMADRYARPSVALDRLFEAAYDHPEGPGGGSPATCECCNASRLLERPARSDDYPRIHYGKIASGNQVIKDGETRDRIARDVGAVCFEMEAAGIIDASLPCLAVRGISDYADSHKNKQWKGYAAATAAAYTKELLSIIPADRSLSDLRRYLLDSLGFDEMDSRQLTIKKAHNKTCDWLLDHPDYLHWLDPNKYTQHHGFLWINGKPGAGKSTLMNFAYEHENHRKHWRPVDAATTVSFFFNARGVELESRWRACTGP
jgi:nucleoside phosphorylase